MKHQTGSRLILLLSLMLMASLGCVLTNQIDRLRQVQPAVETVQSVVTSIGEAGIKETAQAFATKAGQSGLRQTAEAMATGIVVEPGDVPLDPRESLVAHHAELVHPLHSVVDLHPGVDSLVEEQEDHAEDRDHEHELDQGQPGRPGESPGSIDGPALTGRCSSSRSAGHSGGAPPAGRCRRE